jgi:hypothetical protein
MAHTISIDFDTYSVDKLLNTYRHNLRLTKIKSSINDESFYIYPNGKLDKLKSMMVGKSNKKIYNKVRSEYQQWEAEDKLKIKQSGDKFPCGKKKAWNDLKHQVVGEGVIWFGAGFELEETKLDSIKKFRESEYTAEENKGVEYKSPNQTDKLKIIDQAIENVKKYFKEMDAEEPTNFVLHSDEKGQSHLHFHYRNSDLKTGRSLQLHDSKHGSRSQDMICANMEEYGIVRGIPNAEKKKIKTFKKVNPTQHRLNKEISDGLMSGEKLDEIGIGWLEYLKDYKDAVIVGLEDLEFFNDFKARSKRIAIDTINTLEAGDNDGDGSKAQNIFDEIANVQKATTPKQLFSAGNKLARKSKASLRPN